MVTHPPQVFQLDDSGEAHSSAGDDRFLQWFSIGDWLGTDKQLQGAQQTVEGWKKWMMMIFLKKSTSVYINNSFF